MLSRTAVIRGREKLRSGAYHSGIQSPVGGRRLLGVNGWLVLDFRGALALSQMKISVKSNYSTGKSLYPLIFICERMCASTKIEDKTPINAKKLSPSDVTLGSAVRCTHSQYSRRREKGFLAVMGLSSSILVMPSSSRR